MTENKRFIIDDAGTLIDIETRNMFDIVEEICPLLNELNNENNRIKQTIKEAYESERTQIGRNVLRQLMEAIQ